MIASLLLYFFNHILVFFVVLFEFSLKFLTSVYRVTVNHFRMGGGQFYRSFIIRALDYLFYYTNFFNRDTFFNFSIFTIIGRYFLLLHSWIIFLTSGTLYNILKMSLFLYSRNRPVKLNYNKATKRKCVTLSHLKLLLLCFFLF